MHHDLGEKPVLRPALEQGLRLNTIDVTSIDPDDQIQDHLKQKRFCLHINGSIASLDENALDHKFKLTDSSYSNPNYFVRNPWCPFFKKDLHVAKCVFFIGYSLYDLDIKRILIESKDLNAKLFFVVSDREDELRDSVISNYGNVIKIGLEGFSKLVEEGKKNFKPIPKVDPGVFESMLVYRPTVSVHEAIRDKDEFDLFMFGKTRESFIYQTLFGPNANSYLCKRKEFLHFSDSLSKKNGGVFVFHSDMGNGKTILVDLAKSAAHQMGFPVFEVTRDTAKFEEEFDLLQKKFDQVVLVCENYLRHRDIIKHISQQKSSNLILILTERTSSHDVEDGYVSEIFDSTHTYEYDLNQLIDPEINWFVARLNELGLWGVNSNLSNQKKFQLIKNDFHSEIRFILLSVLNSPQIIDRLRDLFDRLNKREKYFDVVICILALNILDIGSDYQLLSDLVPDADLYSQEFRRDVLINELLSFDRDQVRAKSSILARHVFENLNDSNSIIDILINIALTAESLYRVSDVYKEISKQFVKYSNLQLMLPSKNRRDACVKFYEDLKTISFHQRNPQFWLQYAIARMAFKEYPIAEKYFSTSYSLARAKPGYDTFQIDNHFARFCIEKAISLAPSNSFELFVSADKLIQMQIIGKRSNQQYPYRVARKYFDFHEKFKSTLGAVELGKVNLAITKVYDKSKTLPAGIQSQKYISEFQKMAMDYLKAIK